MGAMCSGGTAADPHHADPHDALNALKDKSDAGLKPGGKRSSQDLDGKEGGALPSAASVASTRAVALVSRNDDAGSAPSTPTASKLGGLLGQASSKSVGGRDSPRRSLFGRTVEVHPEPGGSRGASVNGDDASEGVATPTRRSFATEMGEETLQLTKPSKSFVAKAAAPGGSCLKKKGGALKVSLADVEAEARAEEMAEEARLEEEAEKKLRHKRELQGAVWGDQMRNGSGSGSLNDSAASGWVLGSPKGLNAKPAPARTWSQGAAAQTHAPSPLQPRDTNASGASSSHGLLLSSNLGYSSDNGALSPASSGHLFPGEGSGRWSVNGNGATTMAGAAAGAAGAAAVAWAGAGAGAPAAAAAVPVGAFPAASAPAHAAAPAAKPRVTVSTDGDDFAKASYASDSYGAPPSPSPATAPSPKLKFADAPSGTDDDAPPSPAVSRSAKKGGLKKRGANFKVSMAELEAEQRAEDARLEAEADEKLRHKRELQGAILQANSVSRPSGITSLATTSLASTKASKSAPGSASSQKHHTPLTQVQPTAQQLAMAQQQYGMQQYNMQQQQYVMAQAGQYGTNQQRQYGGMTQQQAQYGGMTQQQGQYGSMQAMMPAQQQQYLGSSTAAAGTAGGTVKPSYPITTFRSVGGSSSMVGGGTAGGGTQAAVTDLNYRPQSSSMGPMAVAGGYGNGYNNAAPAAQSSTRLSMQAGPGQLPKGQSAVGGGSGAMLHQPASLQYQNQGLRTPPPTQVAAAAGMGGVGVGGTVATPPFQMQQGSTYAKSAGGGLSLGAVGLGGGLGGGQAAGSPAPFTLQQTAAMGGGMGVGGAMVAGQQYQYPYQQQQAHPLGGVAASPSTEGPRSAGGTLRAAPFQLSAGIGSGGGGAGGLRVIADRMAAQANNYGVGAGGMAVQQQAVQPQYAIGPQQQALMEQYSAIQTAQQGGQYGGMQYGQNGQGQGQYGGGGMVGYSGYGGGVDTTGGASMFGAAAAGTGQSAQQQQWGGSTSAMGQYGGTPSQQYTPVFPVQQHNGQAATAAYR